jgi:hypothetical protein
MAEIEIGILSRQSIKGRVSTEEKLVENARLWREARNQERAVINWRSTVKRCESEV